MRKLRINAEEISKQILAKLDDEQLKQIAGGANPDMPEGDEPDEDSCGLLSCNTKQAAELQ